MFKKIAGALAAVALLATAANVDAQNAQRQRRRPAPQAGVDNAINGAAIAAGIGLIVAIAAVALISNNQHTH